MTLPIKLSTKSTTIIGGGKILLPEEVSLEFRSDTYDLKNLLVTIRKGNEERQYKPNGKPIDISDLCKTAGLVEIEASLIANLQPVKTWRVESLLLVEVKGGFEAIPEIEALREEINLVKSAIRDLAKVVNSNEY